MHIVVCRFYFIHFVFSVGEQALCNRTKEECNVLELALANHKLLPYKSSHFTAFLYSGKYERNRVQNLTE